MTSVKFLSELEHSLSPVQPSAMSVLMLVDRAKELEEAWSQKILSISYYVGQLPPSTYSAFADAVAEAIESALMTNSRSSVLKHEASLKEFVDRLHDCGLDAKAEHLRTVLTGLQKVEA
jgi:hypothetical protein